MKVIVFPRNYKESGQLEEDEKGKDSLNWYLLADSALTNTGKPFYMPQDMGKVTVSLSVAIRINRLGKSIAGKFASRYFSESAPVLNFQFSELKEKLQKRGLDITPAINFDRCLFIGEFRRLEDQQEIYLVKNGAQKLEWDRTKLLLREEELIENISRLNTLKMGDIILPGLSGNIEVGLEDKFVVKRGVEEEFYVKVK